jgi:hypothetical protein
MIKKIVFIFIEQVPGYFMREDKDCLGNDFIGPRDVISPLVCAEVCSQTVGCVGFVFIETKTTSNCYSKNKCDSLRSLTSVNTYFKGIHKYYIY